MPSAIKPSQVRAAAIRVFGERARMQELPVSYLTQPAVLIFIGDRALRFEGPTHSRARAFAIEVLSQLAEAP